MYTKRLVQIKHRNIRSGATISVDFVSHNYIQLPHYIMIEKHRIIQRTFM